MSADDTPARPTPATHWETHVVGDRWQVYADRFDRLYAEGADLEGEARFVDALAPRGAAILDAGCGTGRVAAALDRMGHRAIGVDKDPRLLQIGRGRYPGVRLLERDLLALDGGVLAADGGPERFDVVVVPGNVLVYVAPRTERQVLRVLSGLLQRDGRLVTGFATDRDYTVADLDRDAAAVGLTLEFRFGTWHLDPYRSDSSWATSVFRR